MKVLYLGPLWPGSTARQRCEAMRRVPGVDLTAVDSVEPCSDGPPAFIDRLRHRLRLPRDRGGVNGRLLEAVASALPEVLFVDSVRVLTRDTLRWVRRAGVARLVFYTPDDIVARHNLSRQLERSSLFWDLFFTTKSFNIAELLARGVRRPQLIGKAFDPSIHRPLAPEEVGADFERFDLALVATWEAERMRSVNALTQAGMKVVVVGNGWQDRPLDPGVELRAPAYESDYTRALHWGKLCLCPLRKLNRDRVTQRSVEIPAARRPMLAEKTDEHDALFEDGVEYVSYASDDGLVAAARGLLGPSGRRQSVAEAGYRRCFASGYSVDDRAREMAAAIALLS